MSIFYAHLALWFSLSLFFVGRPYCPSDKHALKWCLYMRSLMALERI
jgi:hypothetical protein